MLSYFARRLIGTIPTLLGVAALIFLLFHWFGGDPALQMVGNHASAERIAEVRQQYGLDRPLGMQFLDYLGEIVTFDFGRSFKTHQRINELILAGIGPTLTLVLPAFAMTTGLAILIGLLAAYYRGRWIDRLVVFLCVVGMSVSVLAYIVFGQYILAYKLGWFPISGWDAAWPDRFQYVALPGLIFLLVSLGFDVRFYRTAFIEEVAQDYVRTARAKGLAEPVVLLRHVLKNSLVPIVTHVLTELPVIVLGVFLLEGFFGIPGIGGLTIQALRDSDSPVIRAMATTQALLLIGANLLTDLIYAWGDPRVRFK